MITPQQILAIAEPIENIYAAIVDELLINIGRHVRAPTWTHTASWEIQKLSEMGQLTRENAEIINKWIKSMPAEVREAMEETRKAALEKLEKQMERAMEAGYVTPPMADSVEQVLKDYAAQAVDKFNLVNTNMLNSSVDMYQQAILDIAGSVAEAEEKNRLLLAQAQATQKALNEATAGILTGSETRVNAVRRTLVRIADEGLTGFIDRAGRNWTPEAYVNMVTRTTVHNVSVQAARARMQDYGTEVFQVSSHAGARPLCYPYQGKFYSWDNTEGDIELGDGRSVHYEPIDSTSYGEPAGLFGINCGHFPIPIIPGVSIPHGSGGIQPEEENEREYAESQQQRALERDVREKKRVVEMLGDTATDAQRAAVKDAQEKVRVFCKETGRTRRYDREQIGPQRRVNTPKGE